MDMCNLVDDGYTVVLKMWSDLQAFKTFLVASTIWFNYQNAGKIKVYFKLPESHGIVRTNSSDGLYICG